MTRVLFVCSRNSVRSPMAEQLARARLDSTANVASAGLVADELDGFAIAALAELGLQPPPHPPQALDALNLRDFDTVIALSGDAEEAVRADGRPDVERWVVPDPTANEGNREQRMDGYRAVRDLLATRIRQRFGGESA